MKPLRVLSIIGIFSLLSGAVYADGLITSSVYGTRAEGGAYTILGGTAVSDVYDTNPDGTGMSLIGFGNSGVPGATAGSYASLVGNSITSYAFADTYGVARGFSAMWDTLSFSGTSPGAFALFTLTASIDTNGIDNSWAYAYLALTVGDGIDYGSTQLVTDGPLVGNLSIEVKFPLKDGPVQFIAANQSFASASVEGGVYSSHTIIDPSISLVIPDDLTVYSASGVQYPITSNDAVPEPSTLSLLALATAVIARRLRNKPTSSGTRRN